MTIQFWQTRRSIRPYGVSFALPQREEDEENEVFDDAEEMIVDQYDVVDEKISLLQVRSVFKN